MGGNISCDFTEIESRIDNWRRFFHQGIRFECVPYYTPPITGNVINDQLQLTRFEPETQAAIMFSISQQKDIVGRIPVEMQDAIKLENTWRNMSDIAKKVYIKLEKIEQISKTEKGCFILWRKMKKFGVRINSFESLSAYDRSVLEYFDRQLA